MSELWNKTPVDALDTDSWNSLNTWLTKEELMEQMKQFKQCKANAEAAREEELSQNVSDLEWDLDEALRSCENSLVDGIQNEAKD